MGANIQVFTVLWEALRILPHIHCQIKILLQKWLLPCYLLCHLPEAAALVAAVAEQLLSCLLTITFCTVDVVTNQNGLSFTLIITGCKLQCFRRGPTVHAMGSEVSKRGTRHKATNTKLLCLPQFSLPLNACQSLQWNTIKALKRKDEEPTHNNKVHTVPWDSQKLTYKVLSFTRITSLFPAPWIT